MKLETGNQYRILTKPEAGSLKRSIDINKEALDLNYTFHQMDLKDMLENFPSNSSRRHILLKNTWNILQDKSR